jgi:hypothetical protein
MPLATLALMILSVTSMRFMSLPLFAGWGKEEPTRGVRAGGRDVRHRCVRRAATVRTLRAHGIASFHPA